MTKTIFDNFTGKYSLSKTLRFELKPVGKTAEWIEKTGLLKTDEQRAIDYKEVKKIIDEYHKEFIARVLSGVTNLKNLRNFYNLYKTSKEKQDTGFDKKFENAQKLLRKEIVDVFKKDEQYQKLFKKELIQELLPEFISKDIPKEKLVEGFQRWTTYFKGFNENRQNMYSDEDKATAIAYRIVNENLPKFIDNLKVYKDIKSKIKTTAKSDQVFSLEYFVHVLTQYGIDEYNAVIGGIPAEAGKEKIKGLNEDINLYNQKQDDKKNRLPKFKQLYKQILSDKQSFLDVIENDQELLNAINGFYRENILAKHKINGEDKDVLSGLKELLNNINGFDVNKIYLRNDTALTDISQKVFGDWGGYWTNIE
ncbi:putative CRISPR-associated protein [Candidatus Termititenax dinenymphae]|uniref:CRISPR-associated protein n=1 Tax=Candidatus Termititenax dinenymphae TaxID=2218523 RepID=A0A388TJE5_9BACT|nr:putative CRISPR-associated protein [Candidatus Termititenax dinenymphae]